MARVTYPSGDTTASRVKSLVLWLESARDRLNDVNPNVDVALYDERLTSANAMPRCIAVARKDEPGWLFRLTCPTNPPSVSPIRMRMLGQLRQACGEARPNAMMSARPSRLASPTAHAGSESRNGELNIVAVVGPNPPPACWSTTRIV